MRILGVARLQIGWSGIVNIGVDAADAKIFAKFVALIDANGVLVPHLLHIGKNCGLAYDGISDFAIVGLSYLAASLGFLVEIAQFHSKRSCLYFVDSAIISGENIVVAAVAAIVGKRSHSLGYLGVVSGNGSGIAEGAEVFGGVEPQSGSISERTGGICAVQARARCFSSYGLGVIFDYHQIVALGELLQRRVPAGCAVEMHRHNAASARIYHFFDFRCVEVERSSVGIYKARHQAIACDGKHRCYVGVGRHDDFVAVGKDAFFFISSDD